MRPEQRRLFDTSPFQRDRRTLSVRDSMTIKHAQGPKSLTKLALTAAGAAVSRR